MGRLRSSGTPHNLLDSSRYILHLRLAHGWIKRQRYQPRVQFKRSRASVLRQIGIWSEIGVKRNGYEVNAGSDVLVSELTNKLLAINGQSVEVQAQGIKVPRVAARFVIGGEFEFGNVGKGLIIEPGILRASADESFLFSQLMNADSGLDIAEIVFEAAAHDLVKPVSLL